MMKWAPVAEMPEEMRSAFIWHPGQACWQIAHKGDDGVWKVAFGLCQAVVADFERYYFVPLTVVPPLPVLVEMAA